ncbi:MAG: oligosaccharide flippase family protein [Hyphomicrobiales bacterium]|nr:oligosaccharide flippase family protein [Hyphomicrobiales bacterium]
MTVVRRALLLSTADRYFTFASNFAVAAAVSRILTPAEIGVSVVGMAILGIALSVREFASSTFIIQREVLTREDVRASSTVMLILTAIIVVALFVATPALARAYGEERLAAYFHIVCVCLFLDLIAIQIVALLRREMAYGRIVAIDLAGAAAGALTTIVLALSGFSYMSFAWAWLATSVVAGVMSLALHPHPWIFRPSFSHWHGVVRFGGYNGGIALLYKVYDTVPYMLFGWILSPQAAAVFSRSLMICQLPNKLILGGAMSVILPAFSGQAREGRSLKEPYLHALEIITALYWPAFLVLAVMAEPVVQIVLGSQWHDVAPLVRVIAIASLFSFSFEVNYPVMIAIGAIRQSFFRALASFPPSAAILIGAILVGGLHAAAWSMLFIIPFQAIVSISFVKHRLGISHADILRALWKSGAAALASAAGPLCLALASGADWRLSFSHAAIGGVAALAGWLVGLKATRHPLLEEAAHVASGLRSNWPFRTFMTPVLEK